MGRILVALYKDTPTARAVVDALLEAGFSADDINLLVSDTDSANGISGEISIGECAGLGALVGVLVGIGASLVLGIGPESGIRAVDVAVTAGVGAVVGALTGSITAGLIDVAPDESERFTNADPFPHTGTIVRLNTQNAWLEWAEKIMHRYQPLKIETRAAQGYSSPWLTIPADPQDSGSLPPLADLSATKLRQIDPSIKLRKGVQIYDYPN